MNHLSSIAAISGVLASNQRDVRDHSHITIAVYRHLHCNHRDTTFCFDPSHALLSRSRSFALEAHMPFAIVLDAGLLGELHRLYEGKVFLRRWWNMWAPRDRRSRSGAIVQSACGLHDRAPCPGLGPLGDAPWRGTAASERRCHLVSSRRGDPRKRRSTTRFARTHQGDGHPRSAVAARPEGVAQASDDGSGGMAGQLCSRPVRQRRRGRRP